MKIICLTPVRNEAWILGTFLKATSLWADVIIIADQMSTDGSREIAKAFPKVILIENPSQEMHQAAARDLLLNEMAKIEGPKVVFALDADEFLSGDFKSSKGWQHLINSKPNDVFFFKWINLIDARNYIPNSGWMYWAFNPDSDFQTGLFPNNYIHEWRLPYPVEKANKIHIDDIGYIHFSRVNAYRQRNKLIYSQIITKFKEPEKSIVSIFRMYNSDDTFSAIPVDEHLFSFYSRNNIDLFNEIKLDDVGNHYIQDIQNMFNIKSLVYFSGLDIWAPSFLTTMQVSDPRPIIFKVIHSYLRMTQRFSNLFLIRIIDKGLKIFGI